MKREGAEIDLEMAKTRSSGRQVHPKGPLRTVDDYLRKRVEERLTIKGWLQKDLAAKLDVAEETITNLLKPGPPRQIKYLPKLLDALDMEDKLETLVVPRWPDLPASVRDVIVALVESEIARR